MADDPNKSNKGPQNTFGMSEIEKIGQSAYSIPKSEQEQRMRARVSREQMNNLSEIPADVIASSSALSRLQANAPNTLRSAEGRIRSSVESRLERSNFQAQNAVSREYSESSINGVVRRYGDQREFQNRSLTMMGSSYEDLAGRRDSLNSNIQSLGAQSVSLAGSVFSARGMRKDIQNQITGNASSAGGMTQEMASIDLAMSGMRSAGRDPLSRLQSLNSTGNAAQSMLGAAALGEEMRGGGVNISRGGQQQMVKNGDIGSSLLSEANILASKLKELSESAGKSTEELDKLRKEAEESAGNFEKLKQASAGGGSGGGLTGSQYASAASGMFNAAGGAIQQIAVGQRLGQVANISGYAGIENQKYDAYKAGRGGDIMSQMLLGQYGGAQGFGRELKTGQQAAVGAYTAGGVAQTAAGGFQIAEGMTDKAVGVGGHLLGNGGVSTQEMLSGAQNTVQGIATTSVNGADLLRGVSTNAAAIQGTQAQMEARRAVLKVQAEQLQGFRDFGVGMGVAAQGMGKRGEAFLTNTMSDGGMQNMVGARLSPEQMAQMSQLGVSSMGSQFQSSQVFAARGLERSGMGSMTENMQRMATLSSAGSNNPQAGLQSVLENAFTKGLDSSKAISMVAENTAAMVKGSAGAALGIDTTAASAALMTAGINRNNPNQEMAVSRAATAAELSNRLGTNTESNFAGMVNTSRLSKQLGISGDEAISLQKVDAATLRTLQGQSASAQSKFLMNRGIDAEGKRATDIVSGALAYKGNSILEAGGVGLAYGVDSDKLRSRIQNGENISKSDNLKLGKIAALSGFSGADELKSQISGLNATPSGEAKNQAAAGLKGEGGSATLKTLDDLRTSGFKQLSEAALQATKTLGGAKAALQEIAALNSQFEKIGATGGEGKFKDAAAVSAETFGKSTQQFEVAVGKFDSIMDRAGLGKDAAADKAKQLMGKVNNAASATMNQKKGR